MYRKPVTQNIKYGVAFKRRICNPASTYYMPVLLYGVEWLGKIIEVYSSGRIVMLCGLCGCICFFRYATQGATTCTRRIPSTIVNCIIIIVHYLQPCVPGSFGKAAIGYIG